MSAPTRARSERVNRPRSVSPSTSKLITCPSAWTPRSVRPAHVTFTSAPVARASACSIVPATVVTPGVAANPENAEPS